MLRPYVYETITADARTNEANARLALAFGIDHIVIHRGRPADPARSIYWSDTAITRGKPAITIESGSLGTDSPAPLASAVYLDPVELTSPETGILYPEVERGQQVAKGQLRARITEFFRASTAEVRSPLEGGCCTLWPRLRL